MFQPIGTASLFDGIQKVYKFDNGFGASVVRHRYSYSGPMGLLWEIAVLDSNGKITYDTPITNDVIGYLEDAEVEGILEKISKLEKIN